MTKELLLRALRGEQVEQTPWLPHSGTHAAQLLGQGRATRLGEEGEGNGGLREGIVKPRHRRRLTRPVDALEGDEQAVLYRAAALETRTRRFGSTPVERDCRLYFSASWCCMRRMYEDCGDSSIALIRRYSGVA